MNNERAGVEALLGRWRDAVNRADLSGIAACYSEDIVAFDAIVALEFSGKAAYREHWRTCLGFMPEPPQFTIRHRQLFVDRESACVSALVECRCKDANGEMQGGWTRMSQHLRRVDGEWKIVHEHFSAPFDVESGKALFDLVPAELAA
jgi:ketosteroid isomerase-like protein